MLTILRGLGIIVLVVSAILAMILILLGPLMLCEYFNNDAYGFIYILHLLVLCFVIGEEYKPIL